MNPKVQLGIKAVLIVMCLFLTVRIYQSIMQPIKFQRIERSRLCDITEQLENIREAQLAYKSEMGSYCASIQELVGFVDTGYISIIERKDTSFMYYDKIYQKEMNKDSVIIRVLGQEKVSMQLFGEGFIAESLRHISGTDSSFTMDASEINKNGVDVATFEVSAPYKVIFADIAEEFPQAYGKAENNSLTIGSLTEPTISGNYENSYCKAD
ncbi:hypothetical protein N9K91_06460 [Schleiferiaceae bacterium]|jgi:hypothetical protein|nr:hypothetical protein [Schleiferiaceae bacterium]